MVQKLLHSERLHKIFKFQGQFDRQGQGHQFSNLSELFRLSVITVQYYVFNKLLHSQGITHNF